MRIGSTLENQDIEKRIAITPEIAKKYLSLGFEVSLQENYGLHLGIQDEEYANHGVKIFKNHKITMCICALERTAEAICILGAIG